MTTLADYLGAELQRTCADTAVDTPMSRGPVAGIEHEFTLWDASEQLDFREVVHTVDWDGVRIDPGDANAYRCAWGGVITADGREAEVVTPPVPMIPGFSGRIVADAAAGRRSLEAALPGVRIDGYSTHLSFEVPDRCAPAVARRFTRRFAPALMLMLESHDSRGVLIRPRRGRLELCGEYLDGDALEAAIVFAAGAVQACLAGRTLPPALRLTLAPSVHRFGAFVRRDAFGCDLYERGREATLRTRRGRRISAQDHLEHAWKVARPHAAGFASEAELERVDRIVAGGAPLAVERRDRTGPSAAGRPVGDAKSASLIRERRRGDVFIRPAHATWDAVVFTLQSGDAQAAVFVTRPELDRFLDRLDAGHLDTWVAQVVADRAGTPGARRGFRRLPRACTRR